MYVSVYILEFWYFDRDMEKYYGYVVGRCDTYVGIVLIVNLRGYEDRNQDVGFEIMESCADKKY